MEDGVCNTFAVAEGMRCLVDSACLVLAEEFMVCKTMRKSSKQGVLQLCVLCSAVVEKTMYEFGVLPFCTQVLQMSLELSTVCCLGKSFFGCLNILHVFINTDRFLNHL